MLVNPPGKFIVQLPRNERHYYCSKRKNARNGNQIRLDCYLRVVDLVDLDSSICKHGDIEYTKTDDLNCVLQSQGVVDQGNLVQETEHEKREIGWNSFFLRLRDIISVGFEFAKDITIR